MENRGSDLLVGVLGCGGCLALFTYGILCCVAAVLLLSEHWQLNIYLSIILVVLAIRIAPPLVAMGAFFGAWLVWEWPFLGALVFGMPGLAFAVVALAFGGAAAILARSVEMLKGKRSI